VTMTKRTDTPASAAAWAWWSDARIQMRAFRSEAGLSQRELADRMKTRQGNVSEAESGKYHATMRMGRALNWFAALDVKLAFEDDDGTTLVVSSWGPGMAGLIRTWREVSNVSQDELAAAAAIDVETLQSIERPRRRMADVRITTLVSIMIALGMRPRLCVRKEELCQER
jgi:transcriptional regulator with XRE-family HTH domain